MSEQLAAMIWQGLGAYLGFGVATWGWLMASGLARLDPLAAAAPLRVKILITPGLIALWPLALWRAAGVRTPEDRL